MKNGIWLSLLLLSAMANANIIYVDHSATAGSNSGDSWENAHYSLKTGIDNAVTGDTIVIAAGTYIPDSVSRSISFYLKDSVKIFGGFAGDEIINASSIEGRDFKLNETILSGDILGDDNSGGSIAENSYHIFFNSGRLSSEALLDGVTLQGANTKPGDNIHQQGAAIFNHANSTADTLNPTFRNIHITNNTGYSIIYNWVYQGSIRMKMENSVICNNIASQSVIILTINGNSSYPGTDSPHFINCNIVNNEGPAFYNGATSAYLTSELSARITNCIVWNNSRMMSFSSISTRPLLVDHSIIQTAFDDNNDGEKMTDEGNNFVGDPMFKEQGSCNDTVYSASPAIATGDPSYGWGDNIGVYQGEGAFTPLSVNDMTGILLQSCPGGSFDSIPVIFTAHDIGTLTLEAESDNTDVLGSGDISIYGTGNTRYVDVVNSSKVAGSAKVYIILSSTYGERDSSYFTVEIFSGPVITDFHITNTEPGLALGQVDLTVSGGTGTLYYFVDGIQHYTGNPITSLTEGDHEIWILDDNYCSSDTLIVNIPSGPSSYNSSTGGGNLIIVPNPASEYFKVNVDPNSSFKLVILDMNGQIIRQVDNEAQVDISGIPGGLYLIKVWSKENLYFQKIVIQD